MLNAIKIQEDAVAAIRALRLKGGGARARSGIRSRMTTALEKCGYTGPQTTHAWFDVCDVAELQDAAN